MWLSSLGAIKGLTLEVNGIGKRRKQLVDDEQQTNIVWAKGGSWEVADLIKKVDIVRLAGA